MDIRTLPLQIRGDDRGSLIAVEGGQTIPFDVARVYYIFGTKEGVERGFHAHQDLQQVAIAVRGSCVMVFDDGDERVEVELNDPAIGVYIGSMIWREMKNFSPDCVLLVMADKHYDEHDYIRDYDVFKNAVKHRKID